MLRCERDMDMLRGKAQTLPVEAAHGNWIGSHEAIVDQCAACVTVTTLSLTVIVPIREAAPLFAETLNETGLSP